jgi:hypothetical protein
MVLLMAVKGGGKRDILWVAVKRRNGKGRDEGKGRRDEG